MDATLHSRAWLSRLSAILGVAIAYVAFAELGFSLAYSVKQVSAVWAPAGIALGAILLGGYRLWPGVWIGAFVANALSHEPIATAAGIAVGNTLGPLAGTALLRRFGFDNKLERVRDVLTFVAFGSAIAMTITATNGTLALTLSGLLSWHGAPATWALWWTGDAMGVLIVTPLMLTWAALPKHRSEGSAPELGVLLGVIVLVSLLPLLTVAMPLPAVVKHTSYVYPFVIWIALRFRARETVAAIALVTALTIPSVARGLVSFTLASATPDERLAAMMTYLAVLALTALLISALTCERQTARELLNAALRRTTRVAQTFQEALLPKELPVHRNLAFDALYVTAEHEALVGGDWYDAFVLADGTVGVSIGDVVGHGIPAAVNAERIRQAIFSAAADSRDPGQILKRAERAFQLQENTLATALVAIIDAEGRSMRYASAGHPAPMIGLPGTPARALAAGGPPIGALSESDAAPRVREVHSVPLDADALLLFYTDGLTEFRRKIEDDERRVLEHLGRLAVDRAEAHPAGALLQAVMDGGAPRDDTVLLTIRVLR